MRKSLKEYITALGYWGYLVLVANISGIAGMVLDVTETSGFPTWVWLVLLICGLVVAPFLAFNKVRVQRDIALSQLGQNGITKAIIVVSIRSYQFVATKDGWLQLLFLPRIDAMPEVRVEDIKLELKGERHDTNWQPMDEPRAGEIGHYIQADIPMLKPGSYKARIIACIDNTWHPSKSFTVEYSPAILGRPFYLH